MSPRDQLIFNIACWGIETRDIHKILASLGYHIGLATVSARLEATSQTLGYPRRSFHVYAEKIEINWRKLTIDLSKIDQLNISIAYDLLKSDDIILFYLKQHKMEKKNLKNVVVDFLKKIQIDFIISQSLRIQFFTIFASRRNMKNS